MLPTPPGVQPLLLAFAAAARVPPNASRRWRKATGLLALRRDCVLGRRDDSALDAEAQLERAERLGELLAPLRGAASLLIIDVEEALAEEGHLLLEQRERTHLAAAATHVRNPLLGDLPVIGAELGRSRAHSRSCAIHLALSEYVERPRLALLELGLERRERLVELLAVGRVLNQALVEERQLLAEQLLAVHLAGARAHRLHHPLCCCLALRAAKLVGRRNDPHRSLTHHELGGIRAEEDPGGGRPERGQRRGAELDNESKGG
mmetsp:Transcript_11487/g.37765  ORF Transcript_11487/g.37765 Transcript_11487/m.37765 type:complete len:263 (+) Transcript_11487:349-1137(+)